MRCCKAAGRGIWRPICTVTLINNQKPLKLVEDWAAVVDRSHNERGQKVASRDIEIDGANRTPERRPGSPKHRPLNGVRAHKTGAERARPASLVSTIDRAGIQARGRWRRRAVGGNSRNARGLVGGAGAPRPPALGTSRSTCPRCMRPAGRPTPKMREEGPS